MPFTSDWIPDPENKCFKCGKQEVEYIEWESSDGAHEDVKFRCLNCNDVWWSEGSDS